MKRTIILLLCIAALAFFATSCRTQKCPAYSYYPEVLK